ncbi:MAG: NADAR family protein, partial [Candidatus Magasanikbacteria bacterium]
DKKGDLVNIESDAEDEIAEQLSNFADTPFDLDGKHYESVEAFWQSIKYPEGSDKRKEIRKMEGSEAKGESRELEVYDKEKNEGDTIKYDGKEIGYGTSEHHQLMEKALRAKFNQNPEAKQALKNTKDKKLTHYITYGDYVVPDSKSIPRKVFTGILEDLREEFLEEKNEQNS